MSPVRFDGPQRPMPRGARRSGDGTKSWDGALPLAECGAKESTFPACDLSVVVPARDEAANLPRLVEEIARSCRRLRDHDAPIRPSRPDRFEIIVVDDSSTDTTPRVLDELARDFPELRSLRLAVNGGQSSALAAGIRAARGEWIATLDADLQNDPADFLTLWNNLAGHDAALGWRVERRDSWSRRVISRTANRVRNAVLGQSIRDTGCALRLFRRDHALRLPLFYGFHRFVGPLLLRQGCRIVQVPVNHRPRAHGRSHYNVWNRSIRVLVDLLGVAWLMRRPILDQVQSVSVTGSPASDSSGGPTAGSLPRLAQGHEVG